MVPLITFVGFSNSGKTTLVTKLIAAIKSKGFRVGSVKHASHGFDFDKKGKDSYLHREAGAEVTIVSSPGKFAMVKDDNENTLSGLESYMQDMDIILCEGFKNEERPKIEIFRSSISKEPLFLEDKNLIALVSDVKLKTDIPVFGLDETREITEFIIERFLIPEP